MYVWICTIVILIAYTNTCYIYTAQISFFWLLALREAVTAVQSLINIHENITDIYASILQSLNETYGNISIPEEPITGTKVRIPDYVQCYTNAIPIVDVNKTIDNLIVSGISAYIYIYIVFVLVTIMVYIGNFTPGDLKTKSLNKNSWGTIAQEYLLHPRKISKMKSLGTITWIIVCVYTCVCW